jgi:hypothetical protein
VDDGTAEAHLLAGLGVCVERVVVTVQAVEMRRLHCSLSDACRIRGAVGRWVVGYFGTLGTSPSTLADVEAASYSPRIGLAALCVHKTLLRLDDCARLALVVYAQDLASDLELSALGAYGQGLEELEFALAIENALGVELGHAFNWCAVATRVEVDDILVRVLEWEDDWVGREGRERWMQLLCAC